MGSGGGNRPLLDRRRREQKLQELPEAHIEPPRPSADSIAPHARTLHPLAATAGREDRNNTRKLGEQMVALEDRGAGLAPRHRPRPAGEGVEEDERSHRSALRPRAAAEALPPPPALEATSPFILFSSPPRSARGRRRRAETTEPRRQQAVLELFIGMVVDATAPCSDQRSSGAARMNPSAQIWTPRSGAP
jgi:hypothetical protein